MSLTTTITLQEYMRLKSEMLESAMSKWPEPHLSIGAQCHPLGRNQCWEVVGPARDISKAIFDVTRILLDRRSDYVNQGEREQCMVIFGMYMIGKSKEKACPTLLFSCERKGPRQRAIELAKGEELLKAFPSVRLAESSRPPQSLEAPMLLAEDAEANGSKSIASWVHSSSAEIIGSEIYYLPSNSSCGIRLAAKNGLGSNAVRIATLGGIVCLQNRKFGLTAAHAFSTEYDPEYLTTRCDSEFSFDGDSDEDSDDDERDLVAITSEGSISSSSELSALSSTDHKGRPMRQDAKTVTNASVWQEAASASIDQWQRFGQIMSVAGNNEADWALIEIDNPALISENLISWEEDGEQKILYSRKVSVEIPADHEVVLSTGVNGVLKGRISGNSSYVLLPRSLAYQEVWTIRLESGLAKGNSGTWVVDSRSGDLLGHIIAGHPDSTIAYMLSASTIFSQLEMAFGDDFYLTTSELSITESSKTPAPAIGVASADPSQADIDPPSRSKEIFEKLHSINVQFDMAIDWTKTSSHPYIVALGEELKILKLLFGDLLVSARDQPSDRLGTSQYLRSIKLDYPDTSEPLDSLWSLSNYINWLEPSKRIFVRDVLNAVQSSLRSIIKVVNSHSKRDPHNSHIPQTKSPELMTDPSPDVKLAKAGINALRQLLLPSSAVETTTPTDADLEKGETFSRFEIIRAINMLYVSLDSRKIKLTSSPVRSSPEEVETIVGGKENVSLKFDIMNDQAPASHSGLESIDSSAIIAFADQCLKCGNKLLKSCGSYMHPDEDARKSLVTIEGHWLKIETQIELLRSIAPGLNTRLQEMQSKALSQLEGKLKTAWLIVDQLLTQNKEREKSNSSLWASAVATSHKAKQNREVQTIVQIVEEIEKWQERYDPAWFFIMQQPLDQIDTELHLDQGQRNRAQIPLIRAAKGIRGARTKHQPLKSVWLDPFQNPKLLLRDTPTSSLQQLARDNKGDLVLIDTAQLGRNIEKRREGISNVARILAEVDPFTFGLLKCRGVMLVPSNTPVPDFRFIFDIPHGFSKPQSLRTLLLNRSFPLNARLELAKKLANSILFLHALQIRHKNIQPKTIIVFQNEILDVAFPFLTGFEGFSGEPGYDDLDGDEVWERNLYRHPSCQGIYPETTYRMQDDIYSLGVVLLEIGLWRPLISYDSSEKTAIPNFQFGVKSKSELQTGTYNKRVLETLAERELPSRMGRKYRDVVLSCLRCMDVDNSLGAMLGGKIDEDGVEIGVRYIENVLEKIHEISM